MPLMIGIVGVIPFSDCNLFCFSWHSLIEVSKSANLALNQSTVKLSRVNEFGCNLPNVSLSSSNDWSNWKTIGVAGDVLQSAIKYIIYFVMAMISNNRKIAVQYLLVFLREFSILFGRIHILQMIIYSLMNIHKIIGGKITMLYCIEQSILPRGNIALLNGLLMFQQSWQQNGTEIFLHLHGLTYQQHVFVMCQM